MAKKHTPGCQCCEEEEDPIYTGCDDPALIAFLASLNSMSVTAESYLTTGFPDPCTVWGGCGSVSGSFILTRDGLNFTYTPSPIQICETPITKRWITFALGHIACTTGGPSNIRLTFGFYWASGDDPPPPPGVVGWIWDRYIYFPMARSTILSGVLMPFTNYTNTCSHLDPGGVNYTLST